MTTDDVTVRALRAPEHSFMAKYPATEDSLYLTYQVITLLMVETNEGERSLENELAHSALSAARQVVGQRIVNLSAGWETP